MYSKEEVPKKSTGILATIGILESELLASQKKKMQ